MYRKIQDWRCCCSGFILLSSVLIASFQDSVFAQITPDGTLPNNSNVARDGNTFNITGGTTAGSNLFHSFEEFSVPNNGTASFNNAVDIQNIISRVTGGSVSDINGLIKANGTANLFLINRNGIVFGENARLDIGGSFVGSTADSIKFGDGIEFSARNSQQTPLLTINVPMGLQYGRNPGNIQVKGNGEGIRKSSEIIDTQAGLRVKPNKTLALVGGDINLEGATLKTAGGRIELGSVAAPGLVNMTSVEKEFSFNYDNVDGGNIELSQQTAVDASGNGAGDIRVWGRNIKLTDGSVIETSTLGFENGGSLIVNAQDSVEVIGSSNNQFSTDLFALVYPKATGKGGNLTIKANNLLIKDEVVVSASTFGQGKGGNLSIDAKNVQLISETKDGRFSSSLFASAQNSTGDAGDLTIKTNNLLVRGGAQINVSTFAKGKSGNLSIDAQDVQLIGESKDGLTSSGLFAEAGQSSKDAGNLTIKTNSLLVKDGARVSASTFGEGKGGNLSVDAQDVQLIGTSKNSRFASGLFTTARRNSTADAGDLTIKTNSLLVKDGARVSAETFGEGKGGNLTIDAQDVQLIGENKDGLSSNLSASAGANSKGDAGDLTIKTNSLVVKDGAQVNSITFGEGNGGNLSVYAADIQLIGETKDVRFPSSLSTAAERDSTGNAGNLKIKTNSLLIKDGARISASTFGKGKGGNLGINAKDIQLTGKSKNPRFGGGLYASAERNSVGGAGDLTIEANTLLVKDGAEVGTDTFGEGKGGNLSIDVQDVQLTGGSTGLSTSVQRNSTGNGGDLTIEANTLLVKDGAQVFTGTFGEGKGGNLGIDAKDIKLIGESKDGRFGSGLNTSARRNSKGDAGDLTINSNTLLVKDGAEVGTETFGEGKGGNLNVNSKEIQLRGKSKDGRFGSGLNTSARRNSKGDAGDLTINTNTLQLENGAVVSVTGFTTEGIAGKLTINADSSIRLNNNAILSASTSSNKVDPEREQATIDINSQDLIMRRNSNIFTNARGENVVAGNINIATDFLIANENSDISADSANSQGGNVRIDAQGIFGTQFRLQFTPQSDITATGANSDLGGTVELNTPEVDPSSGLIELPTIPIDTQVAQGCYSPGYAQSSFAIAGPGGLPPNPKDILTPDTTQIDWVSVKPSNNNRSLPPVTTKPATSAPKRIVEATGATLNAKGQIVLAANPSNFSSNNTFKNNSISCKNKLETEN